MDIKEKEIDKEDKQAKEPIPVNLNFLEFPFFYVNERGKDIREIKEVEYRLSSGTIKIRSIDGVPDGLSADIFMYCLNKAFKEGIEIDKKYYFTITELRNKLKVGDYQRLIRSLKALKNTVIEITVKKDGEEITLLPDWGLVSELSYPTHLGAPKRLSRKFTYFVLHPKVVRQIKDKFFKYIDFSIYTQLSSAITKRIYLYLSRHLGEQHEFKISIRKLLENIPIETYTRHKKIKPAVRILYKSLSELKSLGVFDFEPETYEEIYDVLKRSDYVITIRQGGKKREKLEKLKRIRELVKYAVAEFVGFNHVAPVLDKIKDFDDSEKILHLIGYIIYKHDVIKNPAGFFKNSLENGITVKISEKDFVNFTKKIEEVFRSYYNKLLSHGKHEVFKSKVESFKEEFKFMETGARRILTFIYLEKLYRDLKQQDE